MKNRKIKTVLKKSLFALVSCFLLLNFASCEAIKFYFAGELTDHGISMDSVAQGEVFLPPLEETNIFPSTYDTVFEDCLFVGNRIMEDFMNSVFAWRKESPALLSKSLFFCSENFSVYENNYSDPQDSATPFPTVTVSVLDDESGAETGKEKEVTYKCTVEQAIKAYGVKKVVICLAGINDLPVYGDEENCHIKAAKEMGKLVKKLKEEFEGLSIIVLSAPPISQSATPMKIINNEKIDALNYELEWECTKNGADFINMSKALKNQNGALKDQYCSDGYCELNGEGCKVILSSLRYYAKEIKGEI